uniref:IsovalerylCoA dehydrogenase putative n=1 Tax=Albugo laibachii Nc14 TaxID=890382 RepID=F0W8L9_9STRA|nr:isovalerylCoA dehydrogenase putative [Albugo laibachii Nc14]|eukprot:CCA17474.1 isovalerylCoA dehydrogenase putative [Albugo laibachii Nc14]
MWKFATRNFRKQHVCFAFRSKSNVSNDFGLFTPRQEHKSLREMLQNFVREKVEPQAMEFNRDEKFNEKMFRELGALGLLGITAPEKYGGSNMDSLAAVIAHEEFSSSDPAFCLSYLAHSMLFVNNLAQNGNEIQCRKYLPQACAGKKICGMGMSEPSVGTDVLGMNTSARLSRCGMYYLLNGSKMWITNGALNDTELGDYFLVYARTGGSSTSKKNISCFIVEKGFQGFSLGQRIKNKCGMRASNTAELVFEDCKIPIENLIGKEGDAVLCMMRNLKIERVTLAAMSLGIARRSLQIMNDYAKERQAFGQSLNTFGQIQKSISESYAEFMAGRSYVYQAARNLALDSADFDVDCDGVKLYCGVMAKRIADRAIQTLGGNGYIGDYVVERLWRDAKLLEIGGGTNESHHKNMTRQLAKKSFWW